MDRSAIKALRKRGKSLREIADIYGCDKDTVSRILQQRTDVRYERKRKGSQVDEYTDEILAWIKADVPVKRMLELARVRQARIDFYDGERCVATYERRLRKERRPIQNPDYCEPVLVQKPRARIMLYRDHLMQQDASIEAFVAELCHRHRGTATFGRHILCMWDLWKTHGTEELGVACAIASEHGAYGAEYLLQLLRKPRKRSLESTLALTGVPLQHEVDRALHIYERLAEGRTPDGPAAY